MILTSIISRIAGCAVLLFLVVCFVEWLLGVSTDNNEKQSQAKSGRKSKRDSADKKESAETPTQDAPCAADVPYKPQNVPASEPTVATETGSTEVENNHFVDKVYFGPKSKERGMVCIPEGTEILCNAAFHGCRKIRFVSIPSSLKKIGNAFEYISKELKVIRVDKNNEYFSAVDDVLYNKDQSVLLRFPPARTGEFMVPDTVKEIARSAFRDSSLSKLILPEGLLKIESYAFEHSGISTDKIVIPRIPESVTYLGHIDNVRWEYPTENGLLDVLFIPRNVEHIEHCVDRNTIIDDANPYFTFVDGALLTKDKKELVALFGGETCFVPEGVEVIRTYSLRSIYSDVYLPQSVRKIEDHVSYYDLRLHFPELSSETVELQVDKSFHLFTYDPCCDEVSIEVAFPSKDADRYKKLFSVCPDIVLYEEDTTNKIDL